MRALTDRRASSALRNPSTPVKSLQSGRVSNTGCRGLDASRGELPTRRVFFAADISQLLGLVETTCHLINKENMLHRIA